MVQRFLRVQLDGSLHLFHCLFALHFTHGELGQPKMRPGILCVHAQRFLVKFGGPIEIPSPEFDFASQGNGLGSSRLLIENGLRLLDFILKEKIRNGKCLCGVTNAVAKHPQ